VLGTRVHRDIVEPFLALRADAKERGFDLQILSGFRAFRRQATIWNEKCSGSRPVLDSRGSPLDITDMSPREIVYSILRWSALPGASRHHWGTDIDVFDENARPTDYEIDLVPEEVEANGMFAPLHEWLDASFRASTAHGFFRPYDKDRDGVAPERWHLSHAPVANICEGAFSLDLLRATLSESEIELRSVVLENLDDIYQRFVININPESS
jgi:LAS superfamily LD-carboxypeptidase LdcB